MDARPRSVLLFGLWFVVQALDCVAGTYCLYSSQSCTVLRERGSDVVHITEILVEVQCAELLVILPVLSDLCGGTCSKVLQNFYGNVHNSFELGPFRSIRGPSKNTLPSEM